MNAAERTRLREIIAAAPKGPWGVYSTSAHGLIGICAYPEFPHCKVKTPVLAVDPRTKSMICAEGAMDFMAAASVALPQALDRIDELEAALNAAHEVIGIFDQMTTTDE